MSHHRRILALEIAYVLFLFFSPGDTIEIPFSSRYHVQNPQFDGYVCNFEQLGATRTCGYPTTRISPFEGLLGRRNCMHPCRQSWRRGCSVNEEGPSSLSGIIRRVETWLDSARNTVAQNIGWKDDRKGLLGTKYTPQLSFGGRLKMAWLR
jgi:hypothetical protein